MWAYIIMLHYTRGVWENMIILGIKQPGFIILSILWADFNIFGIKRAGHYTWHNMAGLQFTVLTVGGLHYTGHNVDRLYYTWHVQAEFTTLGILWANLNIMDKILVHLNILGVMWAGFLYWSYCGQEYLHWA